MFVLSNFQIPHIDFFQLVPILVLGGLLVAALCLELRDEPGESEEGVHPHFKPAVFGLGAIVLLGLIAYYLSWETATASLTFNSMLANDTLSRGCGILIAVCALLALLAGPDELELHENNKGGEFCALLFSASLGMVLMSSAVNTIVMFLGLELFSIALYILCIFFPNKSRSRESGMKYFLLSSAASAVLLYGLALLYGATGTTWLLEMQFSEVGMESGLALAGTGLILCGLLFKLATIPFHFWAPDVYEGAPTTVTAFMSVATKVAALAALWRLMNQLGEATGQVALLILFSLATLSMIVGNLLAFAQTNVKRMLAYSGVANAGYLLIAPIVGTEMQGPMMFFLATYLVGNMGAFLATAQAEAILKRNVERQDLVGLFHSQPWLAASFALCLVSLAGLPPAAGFMGKFFLFGHAIESGQLILPVLGIAGSLIGAAYYLGTAISFFAAPRNARDIEAENPESPESASNTSQAALLICCVGILVLGLMPGPFMSWFGP